MERQHADPTLNAFASVDQFKGLLPFVSSGSVSWHLFFTENELFMLLTPTPREYGSIEAQVEGIRASWPLEVRHPGWLRVIPYADVRLVRLYGSRGRVFPPKLLLRTHWRPGLAKGQNYAYVWYFKRGPFAGDPEKAAYARDLLPRILPMKVEIVRF